MTDVCSSLWFATVLNSQKTSMFWYKPNKNNAKITFMTPPEKKIKPKTKQLKKTKNKQTENDLFCFF